MANVLERQIVEEGPRNAVVKLTGALDTTDVDGQYIRLSDFVNNDTPPGCGALVGLRVDHITYSIGIQLEVLLAWYNVALPQQITPLAGRGKIDVTDDGGFVPDMTREGYNGSIILTTTGFNATATWPQYYTVFLRLVKLYGR